MKKIILLFSIGLMLMSCNRNKSLYGIWERQDDQFTGMKIEVVKVGDIVHGKIIEVNGTSQIYGFAVGDVKWKEITSIGGNNFEFEDLMKSVDILGNIQNTSYDPALLTQISDTIIEIRMYAKGIELLGTEQRWRKISK